MIGFGGLPGRGVRRTDFEVHVVDPHPNQFRPPCPGVGGKRHHREQVRFVGRVFGEVEQLDHIRLTQKQARPQVVDLVARDKPPRAIFRSISSRVWNPGFSSVFG